MGYLTDWVLEEKKKKKKNDNNYEDIAKAVALTPIGYKAIREYLPKSLSNVLLDKNIGNIAELLLLDQLSSKNDIKDILDLPENKDINKKFLMDFANDVNINATPEQKKSLRKEVLNSMSDTFVSLQPYNSPDIQKINISDPIGNEHGSWSYNPYKQKAELTGRIAGGREFLNTMLHESIGHGLDDYLKNYNVNFKGDFSSAFSDSPFDYYSKATEQKAFYSSENMLRNLFTENAKDINDKLLKEIIPGTYEISGLEHINPSGVFLDNLSSRKENIISVLSSSIIKNIQEKINSGIITQENVNTYDYHKPFFEKGNGFVYTNYPYVLGENENDILNSGAVKKTKDGYSINNLEKNGNRISLDYIVPDVNKSKYGIKKDILPNKFPALEQNPELTPLFHKALENSFNALNDIINTPEARLTKDDLFDILLEKKYNLRAPIPVNEDGIDVIWSDRVYDKVKERVLSNNRQNPTETPKNILINRPAIAFPWKNSFKKNYMGILPFMIPGAIYNLYNLAKNKDISSKVPMSFVEPFIEAVGPATLQTGTDYLTASIGNKLIGAGGKWLSRAIAAGISGSLLGSFIPSDAIASATKNHGSMALQEDLNRRQWDVPSELRDYWKQIYQNKINDIKAKEEEYYKKFEDPSFLKKAINEQKGKTDIKKKDMATLSNRLYIIGNETQNRYNQLRSILLNKLTK